jgi:sugar/nucleoside kinase (ribokinase family)
VYYDIPAYAPREVVDATGCGDTYMTGYLYRRALGDSYEQAGKFAAAMSTLKLEKTGPFSRTEAEVLEIIR